eukprot:436547_1
MMRTVDWQRVNDESCVHPSPIDQEHLQSNDNIHHWSWIAIPITFETVSILHVIQNRNIQKPQTITYRSHPYTDTHIKWHVIIELRDKQNTEKRLKFSRMMIYFVACKQSYVCCQTGSIETEIQAYHSRSRSPATHSRISKHCITTDALSLRTTQTGPTCTHHNAISIHSKLRDNEMAWFTQENVLFVQYIQPGGQFIHCKLISIRIRCRSILCPKRVPYPTKHDVFLHTFTTAKLASLFGVSHCRLTVLNWRETLIEIGIKL